MGAHGQSRHAAQRRRLERLKASSADTAHKLKGRHVMKQDAALLSAAAGDSFLNATLCSLDRTLNGQGGR